MKKPETIIVLLLCGIIALIIIAYDVPAKNTDTQTVKSYNIAQDWKLPEVLKEVSDIAWLGENKMACVQDEDGIIFVFDLATSEITREIKFSGSGDYEGLAINGSTAYVLRSDGTIFEIENFRQTDFKLNQYKTPLTREQDIEGLALDKKNNRLLLAIKEQEPGDQNYKGVYGFNLKTKKLASNPVFKIKMDDPIFDKTENTIKPSEVAIHPGTGKIFVLAASNPMLVEFNSNGQAEEIYLFNKKDFPQAEGLTFDENSKMYISNEGEDGPATILQVELK